MSPELDRPRAIRLALRRLVAERGFHGASMSAVAKEAGVATGTAYVHYESKEELVFDTYLELKREMTEAVLSGMDSSLEPFEKWRYLLTGLYRYLADDPTNARFLTQLEESPFYEEAHARHVATGDALAEAAAAEELSALLVDLPMEVIYSLSLGVPVRLVAAGAQLKDEQLDQLVESTWRAVTRPEHGDQ